MEKASSSDGSMGAFSRIGNLFMAPAETFESIGKKPQWWVPLIIVVIIAVGLQLWLMDIGMQDRLAKLETRGLTADQMEMAQQRMQGPLRFVGLAVSPLFILVIWLVTAGLLLLGGNPVMGGKADFNQVMGVVAWSSLITTLGGILKSVLIFIQGTTHGVSTSLAALMPVPPIGEKPSILYDFLTKMDPFMVWQVALWGMGLAIVAKIKAQKGQIIAFSLWFVWIVVSIAFKQLFGHLIM